MSLESVSASLGCIVPFHVLGPSDHAQAANMLAELSDASGVEDDGASAMPESQEGDEYASSAPATPIKAKAKAKAKAKGKAKAKAKANGNGHKRKAEQESADNEPSGEGSGATPPTPQTGEKVVKKTRKEKMLSLLNDEEEPEEISTGFVFSNTSSSEFRSHSERECIELCECMNIVFRQTRLHEQLCSIKNQCALKITHPQKQ